MLALRRAPAPQLIRVFDELRGPRDGLVKIRRRSATGEALFARPRLGRTWASGQAAKQHLGFAWYTKGQWVRLRELAADLEALDDSYEDWLRTAEKLVADLSAKGVRVERVPLNVEAAAEWCVKQGRPFNSAARAAFTAELLRKRTTGVGVRRRTRG